MSASISQKGTRCIYCSRHAARAATRCYGTVASSKHDRDLRLGPLPDAPVTQPQTWKTGPSQLTTRPKPSAAILLPREAARSPSVHKIHILGEDERSKFIAHALSGLYESVEMMGLPRAGPLRTEAPQNIRVTAEKRGRGGRHGPMVTKSQEVTHQDQDKDDRSRIDQLVISGYGTQAFKAVESVKDRLDKDSTVCLVNDGLGFLDDVRSKLFAGTQTPKFLLGHMSHKLVYNRDHNHVKQLKAGRLFLSPPSWHTSTETKRQQRMNMRLVDTLQSMNPQMLPYDRWLRYKLPEVLFNTIVESTCVFLDLPYSGLLSNPAAVRTMTNILEEIKQILRCMPQLQGSEAVQHFVEGSQIWRTLYSSVMERKDQPSRLGKLIAMGRPTDINFFHGWFLRHASRLQIEAPYLRTMQDMIKAKHAHRVEEMNSWIDVEETSVPAELGFRYRSKSKRRQ